MTGLARAGIPAKVIGALAAAAALASAATGVILAGRERALGRAELAAAADRQAERLAVALREPLYAFDFRTAAALARAELQDPEAKAIEVRELGGRTLVLVRRGPEVVEEAAPPADGDLVVRRRPVRVERGGQVSTVGEVAVHLTPEIARARFARALLVRLAERVGLIALLGALGWWLLGRALVRPLDALHAAVLETQRLLGRVAPGALPELDPLAGDRVAFRELRVMGRSHRDLVRAVNEAAVARFTLEDRLRRAERLDALGQLAGGVAHDLNNLLTPIVAYAGLLREGVRGDAELEEHAQIVAQTGRRAAALTRKLLGHSRAAHARRPVDLHEVVHEAVALLRHALDPRIALEVALQAGRHVVLGDAAMLQNAILNLGVNARDAMPEGGALRLETRLVGDAEEARIELAVSDTGEGMTPEVQARLFEPFFTTKPAGQGTGLGLAAVHGTVKDHDGAITFTSRPGAGTTFRLTLPLLDATAEAEPGPSAAAGAAREGDRVLVVEDDPLIRAAAVRALRRARWAADEVATGLEGIERFRRAGAGAYRAVLLDMVLPGASGRQVLEAIREVDPEVPVLLTSGHGGSPFADLVARPGAAFLAKPFSTGDLARALDALVGEAGPRPGGGPG